MTTRTLLELRDVSRTYQTDNRDVKILRSINLTIHEGEMVAIMGRSGSGKSTLLNILGCLDKPSAGEYRIAGQDTQKLMPDALATLRREHVGFVFQKYNLLPGLTALENVMMPACYTSMDRRARDIRARALLTKLGLAERLHYLPSRLSGGQQQRVSIARALMNGGRIILADEPTGALDKASHSEVLTQLSALHQEGFTVIIVTHDPEVAADADRIIEISDGEIISDRRTRTPRPANSDIVFSVLPSTESPRWPVDRFRTALSMAWHAMLSHRLRTALSMIGIVIGIASVIAITGLGQGAKQRVVSDMQASGANTLEIYPGTERGDDDATMLQSLRESDLSLLAAQPVVDSLSPVTYGAGTVRQGNQKVNVTVNGVSENWPRVNTLTLKAGIWFSQDDVERRVQSVVIDENLSHRLSVAGQSPLGDIILLGKVPFRIIGIASVHNTWFNNDQNLYVWLPWTTWRAQFSAQEGFSSIRVRLREGTRAWQLREFSRVLARQHGQKDFFFLTNDSLVRTVQKTANTLTLMVSAIAVVSLIVGGVGVMNIMLVSVSERTHEIGLRMAVGARQSDIRQQFLLESVLICFTGAIAGVVLAWGVGGIFSLMQSTIVMSLTPLAVVGACITAAVTGIGFGFVPARIASSLSPVTALARE